MALSRFRQVKTADEEAKLVEIAVPKSTRYKNNWAYGTFEQRQKERLIKVLNVEISGLFRDYDFHLVQSLDKSLIEMNALSLNYWLSKFNLCKRWRNQRPSNVIPQEQCMVFIIAGIRYLAEKEPGDDLNLLSTSDNR